MHLSGADPYSLAT